MFRDCGLFAVVFFLGCNFALPKIGDSADLPTTYEVGLAEVDITPAFPVRLAGLGTRRTESAGIDTPLFAKVMAFSQADNHDPVVLITIDHWGLPTVICDEVANRLETKSGLKRSHLSFTCSNSYSAPLVSGMSTAIFGEPISEEHQKAIEKYTAELTNKLEQVARTAISNRHPSRLSWGIGSVSFANNRRTKGGPVDHDLPLLAVKSTEGTLRAVYVSYACQGTPLADNRISGDWAGQAALQIQKEFPSAMALVSVGCNADQSPTTSTGGTKADDRAKHGGEIAAEVKRMLGGFLAPIHGEISANWTPLSLEFAALTTRSEWEVKSKKSGAEGYHARLQLERLNRGLSLRTDVSYPIQSWSFGDSLAMVFLPGEVAVEPGLRLKKELDGQRVWVNSGSNDVSCKILSDKSLAGKGYDSIAELVAFNLPSPLKPGAENRIAEVVHTQLDSKFRPPYDTNKTNGSMPKSAQQSLATMQTTPNLRVDLVAAEPLIADPVAIDFGLEGELWVAEMSDYPTGLPHSTQDAKPQTSGTDFIPGGRIRLVRDRDGDGQFDSSTVFLDKIPLPTGVTVWRKGVLVCSAPDIIYAEDTDGDDRADVVKKLFSGFRNTNIQARVNSLTYGIDGWIHGSCGFAGGTITNSKGEKYELGNRDFRMNPDTGEIEAAAGRTQQGRPRDEFGNWFGCDNLNMAFHYPLPEQYLKRNPHIVYPANRVNLTSTEDSRRLFPARADAQRFQLSGAPGTVTAACGLGVYRDTRLGPDYVGNLFACEPVNLLVHRMVLKPSGSSFVAERPTNESQTEFLRSNDSWFRPVQAVTGPDGAVWVVDMYRYIIENPRWIPENELAGLDVRAGAALGRIYRVRNATENRPPATRYTSGVNTTPDELANASSVYRELEIAKLLGPTRNLSDSAAKRGASSPTSEHASVDPISRINRFRILEARGELVEEEILQALTDTNPRVREFSLLLAEHHLQKKGLPKGVADATRDIDAHVRKQAACSIGYWETSEVGPLLAKMAMANAEDPFIVAAIYSSVTPRNLGAFTETLFRELGGQEPPSTLMPPFLATAVGYHDDATIRRALAAVEGTKGSPPKVWQFKAVTNLLESLAKRSKDQPADPAVLDVVRRMQDTARELVSSDKLDENLRIAAIVLLGRDPAQKEADTEKLTQLLSSSQPPTIQVAAVETLERIGSDAVPAVLAQHFRELSPSIHPRVIDVYLDRDHWIPLVFDGIEQGTIPSTAMTAAQRQEVLGHHIASVRERAATLFAGSINSNRRQVIQEYQPALELSGDADRGRVVFLKTCSQCHRLGDLGHAVGPNLAMIAGKPPAYLLQELLDPNKNVEARFASYIAMTKDGLTRTGILSSESSTGITLLGPEAKEFVLQRQDLEEIRTSGKSLMPEGLEKDLSIQNVADLIAFLCSAPAISKQFDGNVPTVVKAASGRIHLPASSASIVGDRIAFEKASDSVVNWTGALDQLIWTVELDEVAEFDVYLDYACDSESSGNGFIFEAGTSSLSGYIQSTGGGDKYSFAHLGQISLPAQTSKVVLRPDGGAMHGSLANVRGLRLIPVGEKLALAQVEMPLPTAEIATLAAKILDDQLSEQKREEIVAEHPTKSKELIIAMTFDMPNDTREEYRRIPWIWRVAVACGKRNQLDQNRSLLEVSLPKLDQPLKEWQAVVIGGGIINGIGLVGGWPHTRLNEIIGDDADLKKRWQRTLDLAAQMADDVKINTGTRYDALRMIALDPRKAAFDQLVKYLPKGIHEELQMGAVSGLSDIDVDEVPRLLIENVGHLNEENRGFAIGALVRTEARSLLLLDAISDNRVPIGFLGDAEKKTLLESKNRSIAERAAKLLKK